MKRLSVILLSFLLYLPLCAQFKGTVYVDINQSGTFDKGDKPLEGVMVTDGMNVVKTDRKGRFSLSGFEKTRFISITTPAGFETQQFYLPVKEDRKSYDFIVTESERTKGREHSFIHITDTEVTGGVGALGHRPTTIHKERTTGFSDSYRRHLLRTGTHSAQSNCECTNNGLPRLLLHRQPRPGERQLRRRTL